MLSIQIVLSSATYNSYAFVKILIALNNYEYNIKEHAARQFSYLLICLKSEFLSKGAKYACLLS